MRARAHIRALSTASSPGQARRLLAAATVEVGRCRASTVALLGFRFRHLGRRSWNPSSRLRGLACSARRCRTQWDVFALGILCFFSLLLASLFGLLLLASLPPYEKTREVQQVPIQKFAVARRTENDENFNVEFDKDETVGIWSYYQ